MSVKVSKKKYEKFLEQTECDCCEHHIHHESLEETEEEFKKMKHTKLMDVYKNDAFFDGMPISVTPAKLYNTGGKPDELGARMKKAYEMDAKKLQDLHCHVCHMHYPFYEIFACTKCKTRLYCSKECQKKDWATHKEICK